ncbi:hypothetical protein [Pseudomonas phage PhiPizzaParty]|nr:hypothetical protein [Pseudomonas phage PhiPizzaParty]
MEYVLECNLSVQSFFIFSNFSIFKLNGIGFL